MIFVEMIFQSSKQLIFQSSPCYYEQGTLTGILIEGCTISDGNGGHQMNVPSYKKPLHVES